MSVLNGIPIRWRRLGPFIILGLVAGALCTWKIFEFDLFFHMRAGQEILATGKVLRIDTWTHSIRDQIWYNFEWLSGVFFHCVYLLGGYPALVVLRSILIGLTTAFSFWVALRLALRISTLPHPRAHLLVTWIVFLPVFHSMLAFRYQLRPEIWSYVFYAAQLVVWTGRRSARWRVAVGTGLVWMWAQFHGGSAAVGIAIHCMGVLAVRHGLTAKQKIGWIAAVFGAWLATPMGFHQVSVLWENAFVNHYAINENPDLSPFKWEYLRIRNGGESLKLWFTYSVTALAGFWIVPRQAIRRWPSFYRWRELTFAAGLVLTGYVFHLLRAIPYQVIFLFPPFFGLIGYLVTRWRRQSLLAISGLGLWLWLAHFPDVLQYVSWERGFGVSVGSNPIGVTRFLRENPPTGNLYNVPAYGGYLEWALPEHPVFMDGRGLNYLALFKSYFPALDDPTIWPQFLDQYGMNAAIEFAFDPKVGKRAPEGFLLGRYPDRDWALVAFDNAAILLLRRIPPHQSTIAAHEYRFLNREVPPEWTAFDPNATDEFRRGAEVEVERCLARDSDNAFCLRARAALRRKSGQMQAALADLERAFGLEPKNISLMMLLLDQYEKTGQTGRMQSLLARLQRVAGVGTIQPLALQPGP